MKETIATILQSRMDKCTSEQFWAAGVVTALDAYLIAQRVEMLKVVSNWIMIVLALILGGYSLYFVIDRHLAYYRLLHELVTVLKSVPEGETFIPESMTTRWEPWKGSSLSGVFFYALVVVGATVGAIVFYW